MRSLHSTIFSRPIDSGHGTRYPPMPTVVRASENAPWYHCTVVGRRTAVTLQIEHDIEALTGGAMASIWSWVRAKIPAGVEVFAAHAHIGSDIDGRTMTGNGRRERMG